MRNRNFSIGDFDWKNDQEDFRVTIVSGTRETFMFSFVQSTYLIFKLQSNYGATYVWYNESVNKFEFIAGTYRMK